MPRKKKSPLSPETQELVDAIKRDLRIEVAQKRYLSRHKFMVMGSVLANRLGTFVGLPVALYGWLSGNPALAQAGVFGFLAGLWLILCSVAVLMPGYMRVTKAAQASEADTEVSGIED